METLSVASTTITAAPTLCTTTLLAAKGFITISNAPASITLAHAIVYQVPCPTAKPLNAIALISPDSVGDASLQFHESSSSNSHVSDFRDPFYASTFPICYALAATTVTAYMLLIMLFVTPRSFLDGGVVYLGRRGFTHSSSGGENIGGRPWLQKVAALTVAASLTVATHDTFKIAQKQYGWGVQNVTVLQNAVMGSMELRVIRLISNTFLWLAQAQTLIRLFPRQREKVIIKWAAFGLITLDLIFSALNSFKDHGPKSNYNPMLGSFDHPIPALSYLFQLLLGVLYAAWVIYYAVMKKRYAFYHPLMKNMPLLAIISLTSILIPVIFFIMDISRPEFTGWGDYARWVGAAAASVIVWEWVERIEALEREEKKDGILGREVFDGDETLEVNASEFPWLRNRKHRKDDDGSGRGDGGGDGDGGAHTTQRDRGLLRGNGWPGVSVITGRQRGQARDSREPGEQQTQTMGDMLHPPLWPARPAQAVTPVSRTDTPSAASTVYAVRYQGTSDATTRSPDHFPPQHSMVDLSRQTSIAQSHLAGEDAVSPSQAHASISPNGHAGHALATTSMDLEANTYVPLRSSRWRALTVTSQGHSEESRVRVRRQAEQGIPERRRDWDDAGRWDVRSRLELFAENQAEKIRERLRPTAVNVDLPTWVIPAPPRRGAALQQVLEEEELNGAGLSGDGYRHSNGSSSGQDTLDEMARLRRDESGSRGTDAARPSTNPPLWPGVRRRVLTFEDEDEDDSDSDGYDDSIAETAWMDSEGSEDETDAQPPAPGDASVRRD
ncbi:pH-response regulator protein palH/prr-4 [Tolypocladium ophioglossoides CBS 100239]|uniref:pH-response regulator protein palH/prr-4 n=1 Tax=Tolypocladium ophioglossoides (strain CBS 100239) TaxID=1163406 RepID=A0A0L0NDJ5_TOLOC|nr:pH-response regulator protein palH/prr-4 [Tolypocladium ophioglossoides CBS 100239]